LIFNVLGDAAEALIKAAARRNVLVNTGLRSLE